MLRKILIRLLLEGNVQIKLMILKLMKNKEILVKLNL